jgi:dolichol-phosphate mannosyltransferase
MILPGVIARRAAAVRLAKFGVVGGTGIVINAGLLHVLSVNFSVNYKIASFFAIECAIINNFLWNYHWTWNDRKNCSPLSGRRKFLRFNLSSGFTAFALNWGLMVFLTEVFRLPFQVSNLIGIACCTVFNFLAGDFWVFSKGTVR